MVRIVLFVLFVCLFISFQKTIEMVLPILPDFVCGPLLVAISMVKNEKDSVYCIIFHDIDDVSAALRIFAATDLKPHTTQQKGANLGNIIANQILRSFLDLHRGKLRGVTNVAQFESFATKLPDTIKGVFFIICTKRKCVAV